MSKEIPNSDFFSMQNNPLMRSKLDGEVYFEGSNLISLKVPKRFNLMRLNFPRDNPATKIRKIIDPISEKVELLGYGGNIFSALYEGLLNAHQHGNKNSDKKQILFATCINSQNLEFIIADEGKKLHSSFSRFILALREKNLKNDKFINWYDFSSQKKPLVNNGTGTSFMHLYLDEIKYFKSSELGGLAVYMNKKK